MITVKIPNRSNKRKQRKIKGLPEIAKKLKSKASNQIGLSSSMSNFTAKRSLTTQPWRGRLSFVQWFLPLPRLVIICV